MRMISTLLGIPIARRVQHLATLSQRRPSNVSSLKFRFASRYQQLGCAKSFVVTLGSQLLIPPWGRPVEHLQLPSAFRELLPGTHTTTPRFHRTQIFILESINEHRSGS